MSGISILTQYEQLRPLWFMASFALAILSAILVCILARWRSIVVGVRTVWRTAGLSGCTTLGAVILGDTLPRALSRLTVISALALLILDHFNIGGITSIILMLGLFLACHALAKQLTGQWAEPHQIENLARRRRPDPRGDSKLTWDNADYIARVSDERKRLKSTWNSDRLIILGVMVQFCAVFLRIMGEILAVKPPS